MLSAEETSESFQLNASHYMKVSKAVETILQNEMFEDVESMPPIAIGHGGTEAAFDPALYTTAMQSAAAEYRAAGSMWWVKVMKGAGFDKVPVNPAAVNHLKNHYFARPTSFPEPIVIGIGSDDDPMALKGKLERLSPEELEHALILRIAERVEAHAPPDELLEWRRVTLTVTLVFKGIDNLPDRLWHSVYIRERLITNYNTMARSAYQRIFEIIEVKSMYENLSGPLNNERLAKMYNDNAGMASASEITTTFIEMAISVHRNCFSLPAAKKIIADAEELWMKQSPFNSVTKLYTICSRAKGSSANMVWILESMSDCVKAKYVSPCELSLRSLQAAAGRSVIDLFLLKLKLKDHMLSSWLDQINISAEVKVRIRESLVSHNKFRQYFGFPEEPGVDLSWQAGWRVSETMTARLITEIVYTPDHDKDLKVALRASKSPDEVLLHGGIREKATQLEEVLKTEANQVATTAGAAETEDITIDVDVVEETTEHKSSAVAVVLASTLAQMNEHRKSEVKRYQRMANELARTHVLVLAEDELNSSAKVQAAFQNSSMAQHQPCEFHKIVIMYDVKNAGEAATNPSTRLPSFRGGHYNKMMTAFLTGDPREVPEHSVFLMCDAFKSGLERDLSSVFQSDATGGAKTPKPLEMVHQKIGLVYSEECLRDRKDVCRGFGTLQQLEFAHFVSRSGLSSKTKPRLKFEGSTLGNLICNVGMPSFENLWREKFVDKKRMFGDARMAVGGKLEGATRPDKRSNDDLEPVFYHSMTEDIMSELVHACSPRAPALVVDLTPGQGTVALYCIRHRLPCVCFAHTNAHAKGLTAWLTKQVFELMKDEASEIYEAGLATLLHDEAHQPPVPSSNICSKYSPHPALITHTHALMIIRVAQDFGEEEDVSADAKAKDEVLEKSEAQAKPKTKAKAKAAGTSKAKAKGKAKAKAKAKLEERPSSQAKAKAKAKAKSQSKSKAKAKSKSKVTRAIGLARARKVQMEEEEEEDEEQEEEEQEEVDSQSDDQEEVAE